MSMKIEDRIGMLNIYGRSIVAEVGIIPADTFDGSD